MANFFFSVSTLVNTAFSSHLSNVQFTVFYLSTLHILLFAIYLFHLLPSQFIFFLVLHSYLTKTKCIYLPNDLTSIVVLSSLHCLHLLLFLSLLVCHIISWGTFQVLPQRSPHLPLSCPEQQQQSNTHGDNWDSGHPSLWISNIIMNSSHH